MDDSPAAGDSYGRGRRKRRKTLSLSQFFTDRQSESQAFMQSVWARDRDLTDDIVAADTFENILVYYGFGGLGKTQLSLGLQAWVDPQADDNTGVSPSHWGVPPSPDRPIVTARWDLNDSGGNLDPVTLLLSLRSALHNKRSKKLPAKTWRAFDVAFAAYASQVRPGQPLDPTDSGTGYASELPQMVGEVALETVADVGASVGAQALRDLARGALRVIRKHKTLAEYEELPGLIEECLTAEPGSTNAELASDILFLIDCAIKRLDPAKRPLIIVFVDHLERVQGGSSVTRAGERLLNQLVGALPHVLFVMTGRNALDWYEAKRTGLAHAGARTWPCLQPDIEMRPDNPRPHPLETLSEDDARDWIQRQAREFELPFAPGVVDNLLKVTGRWPVHIDAVFDLARVKVDDGVDLLTVEHLDGSFDDVVQRLLEDLPTDERTALQAASLLPYFDAEFVHTVTGTVVTHGTIKRLLHRAVVLENYASRYAYRVHDEVRRAVRAAGPMIEGGWSRADWLTHATAALTHAVAAARVARKAKDDEGNLAATGLAITIAAEYGVSVPDLDEPTTDAVVRARRGTPSISELLPLIPSSGAVGHTDAYAVIRLVEIISRPRDESVIADLAELAAVPSPTMTDAVVWRGYRLRSLGRHTEAAELFTWLRDEAPDRELPKRRSLYSRHVGVSLSMGRRFQDAATARSFMDADRAEVDRIADLAVHGHLDDAYFNSMKSRIERADARYAIELTGVLHHRLARVGRLDRAAADAALLHAVRFGHALGERLNRIARAIDDIAHGREVEDEDEDALDSGEVFAFRALRDGPDEVFLRWLEDARAKDWRERGWIATEMLVEHLGHPLPPIATQWLEPVENVRARWVGHYEALLKR